MNALIEAYKGVYEDELRARYAELQSAEEDPVSELAGISIPPFEQWVITAIWYGWDGASFTGILGAEPKERLAVYLEWNGIVGYTETIFAIATGEY